MISDIGSSKADSGETKIVFSPTDANTSQQNPQCHITDNFIVIWLDSNFNDSDVVYRNSIIRLQRIAISILTFTNINDCVRFLTKIEDRKVLIVVSDDLVQQILSRAKSMTQLHSIYVLSNNNEKNELLEKESDKVKGSFTQIEPICGSLKRDTRHCRQELLMISILSSGKYTNHDSDQLDQSFMYWLLIKQIISDMKYDDESHKRFTEFCCVQYNSDNTELNIIDEFERDYHLHSPIRWYT